MNIISQYEGRKTITTSLKITGNAYSDALVIPKILAKALPVQEENSRDIAKLFSIFFNKPDYWKKIKVQRNDIDNKVSVSDAWAITRTINFYCFGEPIKYVTRKTDDGSKKQEQLELLSEYLDYQHNHDATSMATICSSVCGLGYKLALPANREQLNYSGVPFVINSSLIDPRKAFCVYDNSVVRDKVLGVLIGDHYDENGDLDGNEYTVWTKYHQFTFVNDEYSEDGYKLIGEPVAMQIGAIPLVEVERNAFRKGDWEICLDLFELKNILVSNRADDIQQVIDYILVLINLKFDTEEERQQALRDRIFELEVKDEKNKPEIQILKNALDQSGVQVYADYIDNLIESTAGIPSRAERGGGGHDTGAAVIYRNGFRDLENNAGMIIPKMDKAETEFISICIGYSHNLKDDKLNNLTPFDIRNKFTRSLSDDPTTASTAYATFRAAGMNDIDALISSKAVTDPSEVHKNNVRAEEEAAKKAKEQVVAESTKEEKEEKTIDTE